MKGIIILLAICVVSEIQCIELCTLIDPRGSCKLSTDCVGEIGNYGSYVCPDPTVCCIAPDTTTQEPTTEPPSTEPPSTTEEPTTVPPTTVLPVTEQCGVKPANDQNFRIIGGTVKTIQDWPWMVSIRGTNIPGATDVSELTAFVGDPPSQSNTVHVCGGVFIHERYVVTTGFCIMKLYVGLKPLGLTFDPLNNILINAGETNTAEQDFGTDGSSTEKQFTVKSIIPHEDFAIDDFFVDTYGPEIFGNSSAYSANNLVLLELNQAVVFDGNVRKACGPNLTESTTCSLKKTGCVVASWGDIAEIGTKNDGNLREADVEIFSREVIDAAAQFSTIPTAALQSVAKFTATPGNVCEGDNGGMVVCKNDENRWALEGLVSLAGAEGGCRTVGSFNIVDINAAWPWIDGIINA